MTRSTLILAALLFAGPAAAGRNCAPHEVVVGRLADMYGETLQSIGLGANNGVIEVFASVETGTWSILVTMPNGVACMVASGQGFERVDLPPHVPEEDT